MTKHELNSETMNTTRPLTTEEALLATILADPADDTVRLAYADWLDENDQPARAEFIRVQCELARIQRLVRECGQSAGPAAKTINDLADRERELWGDRRNVEWFPLPNGVALELGHPPAQATSTAFVSRGFVSAITCTAATFLGGPCQACGGTGDETSDGQGRCGACKGKGRTEGIAATVFRQHPIEVVTLSDKQPWTDVSDGGRDYGWWEKNDCRIDVDGPNDPGNIPPELFRLMWEANPANRLSDDAGRWLIWDDPAIPPVELSAACVRHGRSLAGIR